MDFRFWGVRGSLPTPLTPGDVRKKIELTLDQLKPEDLVSKHSKQKIINSLPGYLTSTIGGNTTCLEVFISSEDSILFDCGSGIKEYGRCLNQEKTNLKTFHIFMTHFHSDHLQGLPFFSKAYDPSCTIHFYSPDPLLEENLSKTIQPPFFPLSFDQFGASMHFHHLAEGPILVHGAKISWLKRNHPGGAYAYKIESKDKKLVFSTDTELFDDDFGTKRTYTDFFSKVDVLIHDAQYIPEEALLKKNWGHSSYVSSLNFSIDFKISKLYLFHYEPMYSDKQIYDLLTQARAYCRSRPDCNTQVFLSKEGERSRV